MYMTQEEQYLFDLRGYLVLRNVLSEAEVDEINCIIDKAVPHWEEKARAKQAITGIGHDVISTENHDPTKGHVGFMSSLLLDWGEPMRRLVGHKKVLPYLIDLIGPSLRLDHQFAVLMKAGSVGEPLHGGNTPHVQGEFFEFKNNKICCGLTVVSIALCDVQAGSGGFCMIPGSHKSHFPLPDAFRGYSSECVVQPALSKGDAVIFPEALIHGALPWTSPWERRALIFKYCPGYIQWERGSPYVSGDYPWEDHQKFLLSLPYRTGRSRIPWPPPAGNGNGKD
jgi:ectoine hydroxylase-related dioxygenase (phytanoyl-CoA dioxygenase family)